MRQFYGKYRGRVANNVDPHQLGRVQVSVPAVYGDSTLSWAMPCAPYGGPQVGFFAVPPVNANVWVEFEDGHPDRPIWSGCFWERGEVPVGATGPGTKVLKTDGVRLVVTDTSGGGLTLEVGPPAVSTPLRLAMDGSGIELAMGANRIRISQAGISINDGALEVM